MTGFSRKHDAWVARKVRAEKGYELTPEQVAASRSRSFAKLREGLADLNPPAGDIEMMQWLARLMGGPEKVIAALRAAESPPPPKAP